MASIEVVIRLSCPYGDYDENEREFNVSNTYQRSPDAVACSESLSRLYDPSLHFPKAPI